MTETEIILKYISIWMWNVLAFVFFCSSIILFAVERTNFSMVLAVSFFLIFIVCEGISFYRKREMFKNER